MRKPYTRPVSYSWWLSRFAYTKFMLRELTALAVAGYAIVLVCMVSSLGAGPEAFAEFVEALKSPLALAFHGIALAAALFHTATWFNAAPKALVVQIGENKVPGTIIAGGMYVAWLVASAVFA